MVKVDAKSLTDSNVRCLFEVLVTDFTEDEAAYEKYLTQSKAMCKAKIPAKIVNAKKFKSEEGMVTCTYHKSTQMITLTCPAVLMDGSEAMIKAVVGVFSKLIRGGVRDPLPEGAQHWGKALDYMQKKGYESCFWECVDLAEEISGKVVVKEERQAFVPQEEEFHAAVGDLCNEVARKLHNFPLWKKKLLYVLLQDFGANPDQVIELCGLTECYSMETGDEWLQAVEDEATKSGVSSKAKAKPASGYRTDL
jgi:hypothetical protein